MAPQAPYAHLWPASARRPLVGLAGWSGAGKTTLLEAVIPLLRAAGLRLALIKHAHHAVDVDHPGKDSHRLRHAGADQVLLTSAARWALMAERGRPAEPRLADEIQRLDPESFDLLLVEGFRHERFPRIELIRDPGPEHPALFPADDAIIAVAAPAAVELATTLPRLDPDRPATVADFIIKRLLPPSESNDHSLGSGHQGDAEQCP